MLSASPRSDVVCGRIDTLVREQNAISCSLVNGGTVLLPTVLRNHIAPGFEITFPIPGAEVPGAEVFVTNTSRLRGNKVPTLCLPILPLSQN